MSDTAMIRVKDLHKDFGQNHVLRGINYEIQKGQKIVLVGPSGCGKSTFLRYRARYGLMISRSTTRRPTSTKSVSAWAWFSSTSTCSRT